MYDRDDAPVQVNERWIADPGANCILLSGSVFVRGDRFSCLELSAVWVALGELLSNWVCFSRAHKHRSNTLTLATRFAQGSGPIFLTMVIEECSGDSLERKLILASTNAIA